VKYPALARLNHAGHRNVQQTQFPATTWEALYVAKEKALFRLSPSFNEPRIFLL
jgi:hypothetical protein